MKKVKANILVVDDDEAVLTSAKLFLKQKFGQIFTLNSPSNLFKLLKDIHIDIILLDMNYQRGENDGLEGLELIRSILSEFPNTEIIPITAYGEIDLAVKAVKIGARDFITKPWQNEKLESTIKNILDLKLASREIESLKKQNFELQKEGDLLILGNSKVFIDILNTAKKAAATDANILITGENGTGKEALARYIHKHSLRKEKIFLSVDLSSIPDNLFESEIFGHQKGAFTDAKESRTGKLLAADGGTLFLDEIGNLNPNLQSKLLRSLQNRTVIPLGSNTEVPFDIRLISATNADIDQKIEDGDFRQDFLYRINTIEIKLPSIRERDDDINLIAEYYLGSFKKKYQKPKLKYSKEILDRFREYHWPGNIRELKHIIERAVILADDERLKVSDFPFNTKDLNEESDSLNLKEMEKSLILKSLEKNKGNITKSARDLGIDRFALYRRLEKYGL